MTTFVEVTGVVDGTRFRFHCPHCSKEHIWVAEQVMNMADTSIADFCVGCGAGIRVLKPASPRSSSTQIATAAGSGRLESEQSSSGLPLQAPAFEAARDFKYKVVPFIGQAQGSVSASDVASRLESTIRENASAGWEFCQLSNVSVEVTPGCLAGLFGATVQYVRFDQLIFRSKAERS